MAYAKKNKTLLVVMQYKVACPKIQRNILDTKYLLFTIFQYIQYSFVGGARVLLTGTIAVIIP